MIKKFYPKRKRKEKITFEQWMRLCVRCWRRNKRPNYFYCDSCLGITDEWKNRKNEVRQE